jgi:hypothetical protein
MYDSIKDNDAGLSTHFQKKLGKKKFRSKSKLKNLVAHELPNIDNLFMEEKKDRVRMKTGISGNHLTTFYSISNINKI